VRRWPVVWLAALGAAVVLGAEWMRAPGWVLAGGVPLLAVSAVLAAARVAGSRPLRAALFAGGVGIAALGAVLGLTTWRLERIATHWGAVRGRMTARAGRVLGTEMAGAVALARSLADGAAAAAELAPEAAFDRLGRLAGGGGPAHGALLIDALGRPAAWGGTQRVAVGPEGPALSVVMTPFYVWLVARRQVSGATGVGTVLVARSLGVPLAGEAVTERFVERTGVGLRFLAPGALPPDSAVIDFVGPEGDTLFAVQPIAPEPATARLEEMGHAQRAAAVLAALLLVVAVVGSVRLGLALPFVALNAVVAAIFVARAPLAEAFGLGSVFAPDLYSRELLGPFTASAGALGLTGLVVAHLALGLWRRGIRPGPWSYLVAVTLVVVAPYLLQDLVRGIAPPPGGASPTLWMCWQIALALMASAIVLLAAALVRGAAPPEHGGAWPWVAGATAAALAAAGLWLWQPLTAWPPWYPYLWLPALLVAIKPMPLRGTLATVAVVSGTAAALLTWGEANDARVAAATRDAEALGESAEVPVVAAVQRAVREVAAIPLPATAGDLYVLYRRSALDAQGLPVAMALWTGDGERLATLDLAELDLPAGIVQGLARQAAEERQPVGASYVRVPGAHLAAAVPLSDGRVLTIAVGPRSRLVPAARVGRFLGGAAEMDPPYRLAISPPLAAPAEPAANVAWRREGWTLRGERRLALPDGVRRVLAEVDLRGATALLQRGLLVLVFDVAVLGLLWLGIELAGGRLVPAWRAGWPHLYRSLRARLTAFLALFFVVPTVAIAAWGYERFADEFRRSRELLLRQTLRDAGGALLPDLRDPRLAVLAAALRVDADLALSEGGRLVAASAPVLADLGLVDVLVPPGAFRSLVFGNALDVTLRQEASPGDVLAGYRLVRPGSAPDAVALGAVELLSDNSLRRREQDLGIATMVAAALGIIAAVLLSGIAARGLARPIQELRRAALALGTGETVAVRPDRLPGELEPVFAALEQAAADVERNQRAERVLAWGEMARQVAHEIKNPLTPIRLGIQHLLRVHRERPAELGAALATSGQRLLAEIDRLDAIARSFSRFALPAAEGPALQPVDLAATVAEVVNLYRLGEGPQEWELEVSAAASGLARRGEVVEVLVNLFENARDAGAHRVRVTVGAGEVVVADDGRGIPAEVLPRVFEPRFSTTTSGSGLGLAIVRSLVESWNGEIALESVEGRGTTVTIRLRPPEGGGRGAGSENGVPGSERGG